MLELTRLTFGFSHTPKMISMEDELTDRLLGMENVVLVDTGGHEVWSVDVEVPDNLGISIETFIKLVANRIVVVLRDYRG